MRATLPAQGLSADDVMRRLQQAKDDDARWKEGRVFSLVYYAGDAHHDVLQSAHAMFLAENALNPMAFKSLRRLEKDVVHMAAHLLNGDDRVVGTMTSGGTESLLLAVKTARDRAKARRPWVRRFDLVLPQTAHPAFDKAAHYFGLRIRRAPVGKDLRADVGALFKLVTANTALVAASAPQYPHGVVDPIEEIAKRAKKRGVPFHVDACVGGFLLPFVERLGRPIPRWDFRVDGVTSISADLHKYGYAAKGASVLLYRTIDDMQHQFFVATDFPGGVYASPTIAGTRPGGPIAAAWAALHALGDDGYRARTQEALHAASRLIEGVSRIPGLRVLGTPPATLFAYTTTEKSLDVYALADLMEERGWFVDRQQRPACIHLTVMPQHAPIVDRYLDDLAACVAALRVEPARKHQGGAPMYGMMARVPLRRAVKSAVVDVMKRAYASDDGEIDPSSSNGSRVQRLVAKHGPKMDAVLSRIDALRGR